MQAWGIRMNLFLDFCICIFSAGSML
jgi:hypothetical protein